MKIMYFTFISMNPHVTLKPAIIMCWRQGQYRLEILENQPVQDHRLLGGKFELSADVALLPLRMDPTLRCFLGFGAFH